MNPRDHIKRGAIVHDVRQRYSYELRPEPGLDHTLRALAAALERAGMLPAGATRAPRFHPHLSLGRSSQASLEAAKQLAGMITPDVDLVRADAFGEGRVAYLAPTQQQITALRLARAAWMKRIDDVVLDPLMLQREWNPHVTIGYGILDHSFEAALTRLRASLPVRGRWRDVEVWDLDVRPTRLIERVAMRSGG